MKVVQVLLALSVIVVFVKGQVSPAIGDIRLEKYQDSPYYEALIYYTDGINPPDWGGICADVPQSTVDVLCRQLGFQASGDTFSRPTNRPVWLKDVECIGDETHVLQCGYQEVTGSDRTGAMTCGDQGLRQLILCTNLQRPQAYDGEIRLCPPDSTLNNPNNVNITSVSYGVVALYIRKQWRGIIQLSHGSNGLLSTNETNAICRQLGFTDAVVGSAVARSATSYSLNFDTNCYSLSGSQGYTIQSRAWMKTQDVKCTGSQNCLGCCYSTPPDAGCQNCDARQDIVIGCTFDIRQSQQTTGTQEKCNLNSKKCLAPECSNEIQEKRNEIQKKTKLIRDLRGGLGFTVALLALIIVIFVLVCIYKRRKH